jgi:tubulin-specific chaperone A
VDDGDSPAANEFSQATNTRTTATKPGNLGLLEESNHTPRYTVSLCSTNSKFTIMAPPSKLAIATGSVLRLVKEEASYHKEISQQVERIKKLEDSTGDENKEYTLKQEVCDYVPSTSANYDGDQYNVQKQALAETRNVLPSMQTRISAALEKLEEALVRLCQLMWFVKIC